MLYISYVIILIVLTYDEIFLFNSLGSEEEPGLVLKLIIKLLGGCIPMYKKRIKPDVSYYLEV